MLKELLSVAKIPPAVNHLEMSPAWQVHEEIEVVLYGKRDTCHSVLSTVLQQIAKAKGKTTAQISLRWVYEQGVSMVAKSYDKERMRQNLDIFDWSLTEEELHKTSSLPQIKGVVFASLLGHHDLPLQIDAGL